MIDWANPVTKTRIVVVYHGNTGPRTRCLHRQFTFERRVHSSSEIIYLSGKREMTDMITACGVYYWMDFPFRITPCLFCHLKINADY